MNEGRTTEAGIRLLQTAIGDYRQSFLEIVVERLGDDFVAYAGPVFFDGTTRTRVKIGNHLRPLRNRFLLGRRVLWQDGGVGAALGARVAVLEYNPRVASVWVALVLRRILRRRTVLWGHVWSRKGSSSPTNRLRTIMRLLSNGLIVYTQSQADELGDEWPKRPMYVAPNAMYRASEMEPASSGEGLDFIYVGRLVESKRPKLLIDAFTIAAPLLPSDSRLVIVGDGPLRAELEEEARSRLPDRVVFEGHVSDPGRLRSLYAHALAGVSPGPVGLSITQALGYGVPMIVVRDAAHGPEVEAAVEGVNTVFFHPGSADALAGAMCSMARDAEAWRSRSAEISSSCRQVYSADVMAEGFIAAVTGR